MKVVILGCGRVGSHLALSLSAAGHDVTVVDRKREAFERLGHAFHGRKVLGLGIDEEVLREAGLPEAEAFIAVAYGDNTNVMAAQIATVKYHVPRVLCRMKDPIRAAAYREMGIFTFASTLLSAGVIEDCILGNPWRSVSEYLGLSEETEAGESEPSP